jgi:hypothetical protein
VEWAEGSSIEEQLLVDLAQRGAHASCKTNFVMALLEELAGSGHRTLVFSQSRVMLDILEVRGGGGQRGGLWEARQRGPGGGGAGQQEGGLGLPGVPQGELCCWVRAGASGCEGPPRSPTRRAPPRPAPRRRPSSARAPRRCAASTAP